jgi:hypothetical protein
MFRGLLAWAYDQHFAFCAAHHFGCDRAEQPVSDARVAECADDHEIGVSLFGRGKQCVCRLAVDEKRRRDRCSLLPGDRNGCGDGITNAVETGLNRLEMRLRAQPVYGHPHPEGEWRANLIGLRLYKRG